MSTNNFVFNIIKQEGGGDTTPATTNEGGDTATTNEGGDTATTNEGIVTATPVNGPDRVDAIPVAVVEGPVPTKNDVSTEIFKSDGNQGKDLKDYLNFVNKETAKDKIFQKNKVTYQRIIDILNKSEVIPEDKKVDINAKITELRKLDDSMNDTVIKILDFLQAKGKALRTTIKKTKLELYKLQVRALKELMTSYEKNNFDLEKQFDLLIKETTEKVTLVNKILDDAEAVNLGDDKFQITNEVVLKKLDDIFRFIRETANSDIENQIKDFFDTQRGGYYNKLRELISQNGGKDDTGAEFQKLKQKYNALFAPLKSEIPLKMVFISNYLDNDLKFNFPNTKKYITDFLQKMFIEYKPNKALEDSIKAAYAAQNPTGDDNIDLSRFQKVVKSVFGKEQKDYIFIPAYLALINGIGEGKYAQFFQNDENDDGRQNLTNIYKEMTENFIDIKKMLEGDLVDPDFIMSLTSKYQEILEKNKVTYSYVTTRVDNDLFNPRFNLKVLEGNDYINEKLNFFEIQYTDYPEYLDPNKTELPDDAKNNETRSYFFGPMDGLFQGETSAETAEKVYTDIESKLTTGEPYVVIGYGKSGSGKTSKLIFFDPPDGGKGEDGIVIEILKQKKITENYESLELSMKNIYTKFPEKADEGGTDARYDVSDIQMEVGAGDKAESKKTFKFDEKNKFWIYEKNIKPDETPTEEVKIGNVIKNGFDKGRQISPTPNNYFSSRSHVVVCIKGKVKQQTGGNTTEGENKKAKENKAETNTKTSDEIKEFNLIICDLAGVENAFVCDGQSSELEKFYKIYAGKDEARDKNQKAAKEATFQDWKCVFKTDAQLQQVVTQFKKFVEEYNKLAKGDDEIKLEEKNDMGKCSFPIPMVQNEFTKQTVTVAGNEIVKLADFKFEGTHNWNYKNPEWLESLGNFASSSGDSEKYKKFFNDQIYNNDKFQTWTQSLITNYLTPILYSGGMGGGAPATLELLNSTNSYDKILEKFKDKNIGQFDKTWAESEIYNSIKGKITNLGDDMKSISNVLSKFGLFFLFILIKANKNVANPFGQKGNIFTNKYSVMTRLPIILFGTSDEYETSIKEGFFYNAQMDKTIEDLKKYTTAYSRYKKLMDIIDGMPLQESEKTFDVTGGFSGVQFDTVKWLVAKSGDDNSSDLSVQKAKLFEHLNLIRLWYNCTLRTGEGEMINNSLFQMQEQVKDLVITANDLKPDMLYWDTLYVPYCYNLNMMSDSVYTPPRPSNGEEVSVITQAIKQLVMGEQDIGKAVEKFDKTYNKLVFIVFLVLNFSSRADNPPNPPFLPTDDLKYFMANGDYEKAKEEIKKLIVKAKNLDYYKTNNDLNNLSIEPKVLNKRFKQIAQKLYRILDNPNAATLLGTLAATEQLQKLNFKYFCTKTEDRQKLIDSVEDNLQIPLIKPPNFDEYRKKYDFKIVDLNIDV